MALTKIKTSIIADSAITADKIDTSSLNTAGFHRDGDSVTYENATLTGELRGPASFIIDPAGHGDNTGAVSIKGDLVVEGTTFTANATTVDIADINLTIANNAPNPAAADGAGITIDGADATLLYNATDDTLDFNKNLDIVGYNNGNGSIAVSRTSGATLLSQAQTSLGRVGTSSNHDLQLMTNGGGRVTVKTNGKVGIGTTNPLDILHISTTSGDARVIVDAGESSDAEIKYSVDGDVKYTTGYDFATDSFVIGSTNVDTDQRLVIKNDGKIGIGTSNPAKMLHVTAGAVGTTANDDITHAEISGNRHHLDFREVRTAGGGDWNNTTYKLGMRVDSTRHQSIDFVSDGSYQKHIDIRTNSETFNSRFTHNGRLGIGTTSPYKKLEVAGDIQLDATDANIWIKSGVTGTNGFINWTFNTDDTVYNKIGMDYDTRATTGFHIDAGYPITIDAVASGDRSINFAVNGSVKAMFDGSGNFGIGTGNPEAPLHVFNPVGGNATDKATMLSEAVLKLQPHPQNSTNLLVAQVDNGNSMGLQVTNGPATANWDISLSPFGGNVGIANVSPNATLHVTGNAAFQKQGNANRGNLILGEHGSGFSKWSALAATHYDDATGSGNGSGSAGVMLIGSFSDDTMNRVYIGHGPYEVNPATEIRLGTHTSTTHNLGGTTHMLIDSDGKIGFGTTTPDEDFAFRAADADWRLYGSGDSLILFDPKSSLSTRRLIVKNTGSGANINVDLESNILTQRSLGPGALYRAYGGSSTEFQVRTGIDGDWTSIGNYSNHLLEIRTNNTARVKVRSDRTEFLGNVEPSADNTYDLGSTTNAWRNIYTNDLHLSNEGKPEGNDVDGTTGNWTIQEGEEHLYIINNKSGKKYKFALEEVQ